MLARYYYGRRGSTRALRETFPPPGHFANMCLAGRASAVVGISGTGQAFVSRKKTASGRRLDLPITEVETCREGGASYVPFQDKDHGRTMERLTMIFFCAFGKHRKTHGQAENRLPVSVYLASGAAGPTEWCGPFRSWPAGPRPRAAWRRALGLQAPLPTATWHRLGLPRSYCTWAIR